MKIWLCILSLFCWANIACAQAPAEYPALPLSDPAYADINLLGQQQIAGGNCFGELRMTRYDFAVAVARTLQQLPAILEEKPAAAPALARLIARFTPELLQLGISQTQIELAQKELATYRVSTPAKDSVVPFDNQAYADFKTLLDSDDVSYRCYPFEWPQATTRYEFAIGAAAALRNIFNIRDLQSPIGEISNPTWHRILQKNPAAVAALVRLIAQFTPELHEIGFSQAQIEDAQKKLVIYRESTPAPAMPFPDVPKNHWAFDAVEKLRQSGIVAGYPSGAFSN